MNSPTDVLADDHTALLSEITPTEGRTRPILDPATGEEVGLAPVHTLEDLERAVDAAQAAQPAWAALGHEHRSELLMRAVAEYRPLQDIQDYVWQRKLLSASLDSGKVTALQGRRARSQHPHS